MEPDTVARAGTERALASITTAAGRWFLGWDPRLASFWATHRRRGADGGLLARADHDLGADVGSCPSVGALEEALGFPLPATVRHALSAERDARPPLAYPRGALVVGDPERPRGVDTYPRWDSLLAVPPDGETSRYGVRLEQERPAAVADLGEGTVLQILGGRQDQATGGQRVEYRLSHQGRVVFAGDDIHAPADADLASRQAGQALLALVLDPEAPHRTRPMSPVQAAFAAAHGERQRAGLEASDQRYEAGTRVAASVGGERVTGTVTYVASSRDGTALAYAWRPDTTALAGHPWRDHPEHNLVSPPADLYATLAPPFVAAPAAGEPLAFGAVVALAHPDTGERTEAVVLRAYRDEASRFAYHVQPTQAGVGNDIVVADDDCAVVLGTWWPNGHDLVAARQRAGIEVLAGEVFTPGEAGSSLSVLTDRPAEPSPLTAGQVNAALSVVVGEPPPSLVKVSMHGAQTRVGDPQHGWVVVATDRWLAAMVRPKTELQGIVAKAAPGTLNGDEPPPVLAALAARHAPDTIGPAPPGLAERLTTSPRAAMGVSL
ncbi:MAG: hypothetical protein M3P85_04915 [Actinomycetota bacterium]|nr:hypothetical protein [Actinomycetota bacterium]